MNLTIRAVGGGVRETFGLIEGITDVIGTSVVMSVGVMVGAGVAIVSGGVTTATTGAGVVIEVTGGAGVAAGGAGVVIEVTGGAGVAAGDADAVVEVTVGVGAADGDHKRNFDATATATMTAQITAPRPTSNFHSFHVGIVGGAINFRLWRVTPAPALSRSSSRICRACSSDCRALEKFPSQIAFVPS